MQTLPVNSRISKLCSPSDEVEHFSLQILVLIPGGSILVISKPRGKHLNRIRAYLSE